MTEDSGVSLLDVFALAALQGLLTQPMAQFSPDGNTAKVAYDMAEAMLKEREKRGKESVK